ITPRTRAIVPTHFPGSLAEMDALLTLARRHKLRVIEDAALVQGSLYKGRPIGSFGDMATFSFHPNKNMTTIEGGAVVVNSEEEQKPSDRLVFPGPARVADAARDGREPSGKLNLSDVSASIGLAQLARFPVFLKQRRTLAGRYFERSPAIPGTVLPPRGVE